MIQLHAAIEQEERIRADRIQGAKDRPDIARVLRGNQRRSQF